MCCVCCGWCFVIVAVVDAVVDASVVDASVVIAVVVDAAAVDAVAAVVAAAVAAVTRQYAPLLPPLLDKHPLLDNTRRAEGLKGLIIFISVIRQYAPLLPPLLDNTRRYCRRY